MIAGSLSPVFASPEFAELYRTSGASEYGIPLASFQVILEDIGSRHLPAGSTEAQKREFFQSLRIGDLVLARACAAGSELAWERFLSRFRQKLYAIAAAIAGEESAGREIADSLYTNLFGTRCDAEGRRVSKLDSYTGRGSLEGWLRAVLARDYADRFRGNRRLTSFESAVEAGMQFAAEDAPVASASDSRIERAVDEALSASSAEDRFILASYYLDGRTLSGIARTLGVHESTVSRRLEKIKAGVKKRALRHLRSNGIDARRAEELLEAGILELNVDVRRGLQGKDGAAVLMSEPHE